MYEKDQNFQEFLACEEAKKFYEQKFKKLTLESARAFEAGFLLGKQEGQVLKMELLNQPARKVEPISFPKLQSGEIQYLPRGEKFAPPNHVEFELKILDPKVSLPKGSAQSAGYDIQAVLEEDLILQAGAHVKIPTGIALWSKHPVFTMLVPRSGLGNKGLVLKNTVGIVDADYQGEVIVTAFNNNLSGTIRIEPYQRIAQMIVMPMLQNIHFTVVQEFSETTTRGEKGFGSTGD